MLRGDGVPFSAYDFFAYLASGALIVATVDVLHGHQWLFIKEHPLALDVFLILAAYVVGHVVAQLSSAILEHGLVARGLLRPSNVLMGRTRAGFKHIFRLYCRPLAQETRERVIERARSRGFSGAGEGFFLHAWSVMKQDAPTMLRLDQFRNLYGFARNIAFSLFVVAVLIWIGPFDGRASIPTVWAWCALVLGIVMLFRYLKFLRQYSYEVLVSYAEFVPKPEGGVK